MSDDPMKLFQKKTQKDEVEKENLVNEKKSKDKTLANLPEDWQQKLQEMCQFLNQMKEQGSKAAVRFEMNDYEFETFMNNPDNFSREDWSVINEARSQAQVFIARMKEILKNCQIAPPMGKAKKSTRKGWISMN
jgi:hypothetical protein